MLVYPSDDCAHHKHEQCGNCWVELINHSFDVVRLRWGTYKELLV